MKLLKLLINASITAKLLISTAISALVLIGMVMLAITSFGALQSANDLQDKSTGLMSQARDAWIDLARGQAALYRAINLKAQNVEVVHVRTAKNDATQAINRSKQALASLRLGGLPLDAQLVSDASKAVDAYAAAAEQAASFVEEDAFNATMFMSDAEIKFAAAQQKVSNLVVAAVSLDGAIDEQMGALMHSRRLTTIVSAAVGSRVLDRCFDAARPHDLAADRGDDRSDAAARGRRSRDRHPRH